MKEVRVFGKDLMVGDVLEVLGLGVGGKDVIISLELYDNDFARSVFPDGAQIARMSKIGAMTIDNSAVYTIFQPTSNPCELREIVLQEDDE